jgi:excisionase family DNA binding protein
MIETPWMTRKDAALYMRVSVQTIDRWARDGMITRYSLPGGADYRYRRDELDALLAPEARAA